MSASDQHPSTSPLSHTLGTWQPRAVVFDCDGILLDTQAVWNRAQESVLQAHGARLDKAERDFLVGRPIPDVVIAIARAVGKDPEVVGHELGRTYYGLLNNEIPVLPGAKELVETLSARMPVAVASNTPRRALLDELEKVGILPLLDHVIAVDDVAQGKPAPDMYQRACELLGTAPEDTLAIEDSETGARAAKSAGLRLIVAPIIPGQNPEGDARVEKIGDPDLAAWAQSLPVREDRTAPSEHPLGALRHEYFKGIAFDCDGLLLDTESVWEQTQIAILGEYGVEATEDMLDSIMGTTLEQSVEIIVSLTGGNPEDISRLSSEIFDQLIGEDLRLMPGAREFLEIAHEKVPLAVASNSWHEALTDKLERAGLIHFFTSIHSASTVEHGKPAPDMYAQAAEALGVEPAECLAFEDSPVGAQAAVAAGLPLIAVPSSSRDIRGQRATASSLTDPALREWVRTWPAVVKD